VRTELHFHLLPGVDDGPADETEALALARLVVEDGTGRVVCTPHVREIDLSELGSRLQALRRLLAQDGLALEVQPGGELSPRDAAQVPAEQLELIAQGPPGARWLLLEVPLWQDDTSFLGAAAALRERGYGLLIGHPERGIGVTAEQLHEQVRRGAILQLNASSLAGLHGPRPQDTAVEIARSGLPFVVASDAHSLARPPLLSDAAQRLAHAGLSAGAIEAAIDHGPDRLFEGGLSPGRDAGVRLGLASARQAA
jgi:protein-tyrosine phosphatase